MLVVKLKRNINKIKISLNLIKTSSYKCINLELKVFGDINARYIISYIGFRQVIRAHITCLCFIFPEPKAREIYTDRLQHRQVI